MKYFIDQLKYCVYFIDKRFMASVTVSPKFQVVIPKDIRDSLGIVSGQKLQILAYDSRIELIPIKPMREMKGFVKGINTDFDRDNDRV